MVNSLTFNGETRDYFIIKNKTDRFMTELEHDHEYINAKWGSVETDERVPPRIIDVEFMADSIKTNLNMDQVKDDLVKWLRSKDPQPIIFDNEPHRIYYGKLTGGVEMEKRGLYANGSLQIICYDPYKYSADQYINRPNENGIVTVQNEGTAETWPVIEGTALKSSTSFSIGRDGAFFILGKAADTFKTPTDSNPVILSDPNKTATGWSYVQRGTILGDAYTGGEAGGTVATQSDQDFPAGGRMYIDEPGGGDYWTGPALRRSMTKTVNDYKMMISGRLHKSRNDKGAGKFMVTLSDESDNRIVTLGFLDASGSTQRAALICRVYDEFGQGKTIVEHYADGWENSEVFASVEKRGKRFIVKAWVLRPQYSSGKGWRLTRSFNDEGGFYQRGARMVTKQLATYGGFSRKLPVELYQVKVNEINEVGDGELPYIVKSGDKLLMDFQKETAFIGNEMANAEKAFLAEWFSIPPGVHELAVDPFDAFDITVKWRDRYL